MNRKIALISFAFITLFCSAHGQTGISFDGVNDHVSFGQAPALNLQNFTLELWFKREAAGIALSTDTDGVIAVPLITKGRPEGEGNNTDMNYFLGINSTTGTICADFEQGNGQPFPGKNHPINGITPICMFRWYHAAVTYDGNTLRLYLDGNIENSVVVNALPQSSSIQHAALGAALNSAGVPAGAFAGKIDEARIWNYARSAAEINASRNLELGATPGLVGRWALNEGLGLTASNSGSASTVNGTLINGPLWSKGSPFSSLNGISNTSVEFDGTNSYVNLGNPASLSLNTFTLEAWIMRKGNGISTFTGAFNAVPLIAKGREESNANNRDINYFLGIEQGTNFLAADYEEGTGQYQPGRNHPLTGTTPLALNTWYHVAVTFDGDMMRLWLNGTLDNQLYTPFLPQSASIQPASIASALYSSGAPGGFFDGMIDEVRIWNYARSKQEIHANMNKSITSPQTGLVGRWGMNEGCGSSINDNSGNNFNVNITERNWSWAAGSPYNGIIPPSQPQTVSPSNNSINVSLAESLSVSVSDPDQKPVTVRYYVRECPNPDPQDFTIAGLTDTQYYTSETRGGTLAQFKAQTNWIVQNRIAENIAFVASSGDCVENGDNNGNPIEWQRADTAYKIIEDPVTTQLQHGIPYGINVGNHDQTPNGDALGSTNFFNAYFGINRFTGRTYYGGYYGNTNNNNYMLFSASGMDFMVFDIEYNVNMPQAIIDWMVNLIKANPEKRVIITSHYLLNADATFGVQGQLIYNAVKKLPNVFLMLGAHVHAESRRDDNFDGNKIITLLANYQSRNGGQGWMRKMKFSPLNNTISVETFSPWLNQVEIDSNSAFTYNYDMYPTTGYSLFATLPNISSGSTASVSMLGLQPGKCYLWYATLSNGDTIIRTATRKFSTSNSCTRITSFSPASGGTGDTIQISGTDLNFVSQVRFSGTPASFQIISNTLIKAVVPSAATTGKISITGTCIDSSASEFTKLPCPPFPVQYNVTGGGTFCTSTFTGSDIGLSGSQSGKMYQLRRNGTVNVGSPLSGTGNPISFGLQSIAGTYTVIATESSICTTSMSGSAVITINQSTSSSQTVVACGSYTWSLTGINYTSSGIYTHTGTNANGCPHTTTLNLTVNQNTNSSLTVSACDSYTWSQNGVTYTNSGTYFHYSTNAQGCLHTTILYLTIRYSSSSSQNVSVCDSYTWPLNGATYTSSGTYTHLTTNASGCPHTNILNLTVNQSSSEFLAINTCDSYTWPATGNTYTSSGTYYHYSTNASGCLHTRRLDLTIRQSTNSTDNVSACDSYIWPADGQTYTRTGVYTHISTNASGCPHTSTLILDISESTSSYLSVTECGSYIWPENGVTYNSTGIYTHQSLNQNGCTHTATLDLTINQGTSSTENQSVCDNYIWPVNNQTYTISGQYTHSSINAAGCTHTSTLNLVVRHSTTSSQTVTACDLYTWPVTGLTYNSSGTYTHLSMNQDGCIHTSHLNLTINSSSFSSETISVCGSYYWPRTGLTYFSSGTYTFGEPNMFGCEHTYILYLTVRTVPQISLNVPVAIQCYFGTTEIEVLANSGTPPYQGTGVFTKMAGFYSFTITDAAGCSNTASVSLSQPNKMTASVSTTPSLCGLANGTALVSSGGGTGLHSYLWSNGQNGSNASNLPIGIHSVDITDANGCSISATATILGTGTIPQNPGMIDGPSGVCRSTSAVFSVPAVSGATSYDWTLPAGASGISSTNSINITFNSNFNGGFICVSALNSCGSSQPSCLNLPVLSIAPSTPAQIIGSTFACPSGTYSFYVDPVTNATFYTWSVSGTGLSITSGQGSNQITVSTTSGFNSGTVSVFAGNCRGNSTSISRPLHGSPVHSFSISGPGYVCANTSNVVYSIPTIASATSVIWSVTSGNFSITSQTPQNAVINTHSNFSSGVLTVTSSNPCGTFAKSYTIRSVPAQPGGISGPRNGNCLVNGVIYSISAVTSATSYIWTSPPGVVMTSSTGTTATFNYTSSFSGSGNICVSAVNNCGVSVARCLPVTATLAAPVSVTGPSSVCKSQTSVLYDVSPVNGALSYLWSATNGTFLITIGTGLSATANFNWTTSSTSVIMASAENLCGFGPNASRSVSINSSCRTESTSISSLENFSVYPNPGTGMFTVKILNPEIKETRIIVKNIIGREVYFKSINFSEIDDTRELNLIHMKKGIYILTMEYNGREDQIRIAIM
ncbi:MAG: T9SS C-terminal target domain-containing protein [Bacteroidetes bacterium]|nr:MAG: T9SS C-terminal target domain-containing protein [Bacteroidota bacterium]REK06477.1 MAG: T9SS C-terminal target domain-containing protein [Bacteroidota bacterium]REK33243.1 MAG: T9SS C-terminal target domain-containing protein [Bacteroidota bacterium]REK47080.1 MAG: T9SS C-terminal target domain-containing protein [Bacteroidota bacterium]